MTSLAFHLRAETAIWTGDANPNPMQRNSRLQLTSLLGGIRWWAEAIVRAHGAHACDPTDEHERCKELKTACFICMLFGNANLLEGKAQVPRAAKFLLRAWAEDPAGPGRPFPTPRTDAVTAGSDFWLEFRFPANRPADREPTAAELYLLAKAVEVICAHGSIGGHTVFKPAPRSTKFCHCDFGILSRLSGPGLPEGSKEGFVTEMNCRAQAPALKRSDNQRFPDLNRFWFVAGKTLYKDRINKLFSPEDPEFHPLATDARGRAAAPGSKNSGWSKRLFSFQTPARLWGYWLSPKVTEDLVKRWLISSGEVTETDVIFGGALL